MPVTSRVLLFVIAVLALPNLAAAQTSAALAPEEEALVGYIDRHFETQAGFLERIVNINSETMNHAGVRRVADIFDDELGALGFDTRWIDMRETLNRAGHLVSDREGERGARLLLIGHMDTVHPPDGPFQTFEREGNRATGPGIDDMKNGLVVILYALKALEEIGALSGSDITVFMTGEEEMPGASIEQARAPLIDEARKADIALNFESGETGVAVTSRRGYTGWRLETTGRSSHSSQIFSDEVGAGAIYELSRILTTFYETLRAEPLLTFNVGAVVGGTRAEFDSASTSGEVFGKVNVVPVKAITEGDIRAISVEQVERVVGKMRGIVADNLPHTSAKLTVFDGYPPMSPTPQNAELLAMYSDISEAIGAGPLEANDPLERGASDISFVAPVVNAALDGLGGYGGGAHTPDEWIDLETMRAATKRAAVLIYRLTREDAPRFAD